MKVIFPITLLSLVLSSNIALFSRQPVSSSPFKAVPSSIDMKPFKDTIPGKRDTSLHPDISQLNSIEREELEAEFPGGIKEFQNLLSLQLDPDVPVRKGSPAGDYLVVAQFVIDKDGSVTDVKALTNFGFGMEEELIRVIRLSPKWKPATQNGLPVKAYRKQSITFVIQEVKRKKRRF